jgi:hypothetical protein
MNEKQLGIKSFTASMASMVGRFVMGDKIVSAPWTLTCWSLVPAASCKML